MTVLPQIKNFINGQWRATETQFQPQNPATHEAIAAGIASEIVMASPDGTFEVIDLPIRRAPRRPEWRS